MQNDSPNIDILAVRIKAGICPEGCRKFISLVGDYSPMQILSK
jgi:hypothetical protein